MSVTEATIENLVSRPVVVTEKMADALRRDTLDGLNDLSPYAACLLPLLRELGWHNYARELIEALPHFSDRFDLVDLRNILVALGYESTPIKIRIGDLKQELYPCLFVSKQGAIYVLKDRVGDEVHYFDASEQKDDKANLQSLAGTVYLFTDTHPTHGVQHRQVSKNDWFSSLLHRFRGLIIHLLSMTFVINLVALIVPIFIMMVYDKVIGAKSADSLPYLVSGVAILMMADLVLRLFRAKVLGSVAGRLDYLIGVETFKQMILLPPLFTEQSTVAAQLSRLKQFDSVRDFFTGPSAAIVLELPFVVLFLIVIAILAGPIALIPLLMVFSFILLGVVWLPSLNRKIQRSGAARTDKHRIMMQTLTRLITKVMDNRWINYPSVIHDLCD